MIEESWFPTYFKNMVENWRQKTDISVSNFVKNRKDVSDYQSLTPFLVSIFILNVHNCSNENILLISLPVNIS